MVEKTEYKDGFRPKTTRFVWNGDDRLTHIELPNGGRYRYRYDPLGRRVAKECFSTQRITEYMWDGANIVQHSQKTADGSVIQEIEYLYEPETFRPLAQVTHKANQASQLHYIVTDHAGTPQELCSENGDVVWQGEQALWGHYQQRNTLPNHGFRENAQNDELYCDLRYQGQIEDRESGLYYNVNRYYDADSGQYLSPDPIGFSGGLRPQAYVFNPLEWVEPLGLAGCILKKSHSPEYDYELTLDKKTYPETATHIQSAIESGHPYIVTIERETAKKNRRLSLKGYKTRAGKDRDEWPMAVFKEGGEGASVRYIDPSDNRGAGSSIGHAIRDLPDGTRIMFKVE